MYCSSCVHVFMYEKGFPLYHSRNGIFERMPTLTAKKTIEGLGGDSPTLDENKEPKQEVDKQPVSLSAPPPKQTQQNSLLDLLSDDTGTSGAPVSTSVTGAGNLLDLLDSTSSTTSTGHRPHPLYSLSMRFSSFFFLIVHVAPPPASSGDLGGLLDFLNEPTTTPITAPTSGGQLNLLKL